MPMMIAALASTNPDAGVIATSPATAPEMAPTTLGVPLCSQTVRAAPRSAVKAEPAEPQQAGTYDGQPHVVWFKPLRLAPHPWAQHQGGHESRDAGTDVNHGSARVVEGAEVAQPAALSPHPVGNRRIDEQRPQQAEQDEGLELLALGEGTRDEGRGDDREHHLEGHVGGRGNGRRIRNRVSADTAQADEVQAADDAPAVDVLAEGQREAEQNPRHALSLIHISEPTRLGMISYAVF